MVKPQKKLKEYFSLSMRKLRHRKGFGVHSPFAYSIITELIEEKTPYYAYQRMRRTYRDNRKAPVPLKVAYLLFRLANRFRAHEILEIESDGGYTLLPLVLQDSRNRIRSVASDAMRAQFHRDFSWVGEKRQAQVTFTGSLAEFPEDYRPEMVVINDLPAGMSSSELWTWLEAHLPDNGIVWVRGIQPKQHLEELWDYICDCDGISVTMDLYSYGLAIRKPRFYKQHYTVSF